MRSGLSWSNVGYDAWSLGKDPLEKKPSLGSAMLPVRNNRGVTDEISRVDKQRRCWVRESFPSYRSGHAVWGTAT